MKTKNTELKEEEIKLEDIKMNFDLKLLPPSLPDSLIKIANEHYDFLKNRPTFLKKMREENLRRGNIWIADYKENVKHFAFIKTILFDSRMKVVWNKLNKINQNAAGELFSLLLSHNFIEKGYVSRNNPPHWEDKISKVKNALKLCSEFVDNLQKHEACYSSYNPSAPKSNDRLYLHGDRTDALYSGLEIYTEGLEKIIKHYEKNRGVFDRLDYMSKPTSRKNSIKNFKAIYWARLIKFHLLKNYKSQ